MVLKAKSNTEVVDESPTPIILFLGPPSSYTHQAALECFDHDAYDFLPATSITDVFEAVQLEEAALGVVPIENSTNGPVTFTFELLADRHNRYPDIKICQEIYLNVSHCLLGRRITPQANESPTFSGSCTPTLSTPSPLIPRTTPLSNLKHIKRLYSHPQAWGQCDIFLGAFLKNIERIDVSSTSRAAQLVMEDKSGASAAIASRIAAVVNGLDILAEGIEDKEDNKTRFIVLNRSLDVKVGRSEMTRTMISFEVKHEVPGALASILKCFATYSLNLTSINSRPTKVIPFQYIFFLEFQGSVNYDPEDKVKNTLCALRKYVTNYKHLGSWNDKSKE